MAAAQRLRVCRGRALLCFVLVAVWGALVSGQIRYSIREETQKGSFVGNIAKDLGFDLQQLSERGVRIISRAQ
uniref:Cadherin N-terminal domain-containing protein n=1 Tax=Sphenodon punctatus TaxID=8508 RepID=A0A8D0HHL1_SPHPU